MTMLRKLFALLMLLFIPVIASAAVLDLGISPSNPYCGDKVVISGMASLDERVSIFSSFEKTVAVESGKYVYRLYGIYIPPGENTFSVTAVNVKNLQVSVKIIIWITKSSDAVNGTAVVSQGNVPQGTYDIKIYGDAADGAAEVGLDIVASKPVTADSNGSFELSVNTNGIPQGLFTVTAGNITKNVTLSERPAVTATPTATATREITPTPTPTPKSIPGLGVAIAIAAILLARKLF